MDTPPMESRGWRKVIIQWIRQCEFMDQNYITLEQSDIKAFFVIYMRKARAATAEQEKKQMLQAQPKKSRSLKTFIEENYPEFSVHLDSHGDVASADYLLVYTLLLHCSCVRNRILYFHNICKSLPTPMQAVIAAFFERAVDRELTRQYLRLTITKVSAIYKSGVQNSPCSPQSPDLNCDATPSSSSSIPASPQEPSSTPQSRYRELGSLNDSACEMPAPPTPKGELLDQRTRELRNIQAELEMVRYEKMMLEEQHIDKDKTIKALEKENMEARTELTKLKDAVNSAEEDDDITNGTPNTFEHLKRSLLKEISEKDTAILEINDKLQEAYSENKDLSRKLQECKKTVFMYTECVRGLEARVKDLNHDIAVRENRIACLERDKQEINRCLQEAREELHSRREVLNASSDLLDCSLSPNTTPENLASSVIDKQLREKEHENAELKEVLLKQSDSLHELNNGLASFLQKHNLNQNLSSDNQTSSFDDLLQKCQTLAQTLESQKEQLGEAMTKNNELEEGAAKARKEINNLRDEFKLKISENELKIDSLEMEKSKLSETCNKLQSLVSEGNEHLDGIKQQLAEKEKQLKDLHTEILDLRDKNESLEGRFRIIEEERRREASEHQHQQEYIKSQHALCRSQLEDRIVDMNQMLSQLNQSDWKSTVERVIEIQAQNEDLKLELSQKMEDLRELHKLNESSQKELENQIQLTAKTDAELAEKTVQLSNSKQEIESFLSRINSLLKSERSSESEEVNQFEEVESLIQLQIQTVDTVELRINIILERLGDLQERNASLQLTVNELRILIGENNAQNETHSKLVGELEKTLEEERLNLKEVSENLSKAEKQIDGNNLEAIKMIATIESRLPKEEGSICTELNNPEQLFHWMNNFVKIYDQMNASRQTLENQNRELNESFEKLKQIKGSLEQKLNDLQDDGSDDQKVKHLIEDNLKLHKVQTEMSETIINITKEMHSRGSRIAEMENTDKQKSAKLDELTEELKARDDEIAMLKDTNQEQMNVLNDSCNQQHKDDDEKANGTANNVEEMLKKLDEEHKELLKTIEDKYEKRCQDLEKSCQDLEKCRNDMEKKLAEKEEEQLVLKNLKAECKQRCQDLEKQLSQIEFQLSEKEFDKDHENEIKTIREQLEDYRLQDQQHRQTIANHNLLLKECESDLKDARLNEQQLRQTIETHKQLLNDMGSNEEELRLRHELENEQKLRDQLKVELAKKEEELRSIMTETKTPTVDVVSDELLDLQTKLQNEQTLTDQLQKQLVQHQEALIKANEEVLNLRATLLDEQKLTDELTLTKEQQKEIINVREQLIQLQEFYDSSKNEILSLQNKLLNEQKLTDELKLELANQQEETRKAKEQLVSYESSSAKLQEFNDSSKNELLSLQNKLLNEQKLTDELKLELTNQQEENKKAKEQLVSYESSSAKLQELHNSSKKELLSLETKILDEQKHSDELKLELEKQQEETKKAKEQLVSYESLSSTLKEFSESSRNELLNLQTKLLNKQKLTDDLKLKLENQQEETRKTKEQLVSYENRMAELQKLNDSSKIEILSLQTKVQDEQDLINDLKLKLESQQEDLKKANEQLVSYVNLKSEVDGLKVALNSKISDIERLKKEHHKELSELDGLRTKLLDERRLANQFKVEQQEKLDNVTAQLSIRTSQLADAQARWEEEKQQAAKERESNLKEINRLESNNKNSEIQIEKLKSELTKAETSHDELHLEVGSANLEARLLKQQLEKSSKMVTDLQNRLETERSEAKENYESVSNRLIEVEEQSKQNLLSALTERNKAQEQVTKLTSRLAKSKKEQREMVLKNDAYRAESSQRLSSYKERLESMEAELAECQQELAVARNANESQAETDLGATYSRGDGGTQSEQQNEVSRQQEARIQKLELDCQILQAKYIESRNEKDRSEQQIKDQRLEMEGKLDKMKDKMDGPHSLDDSMSALLSSSSTGARKKSMGTHYKRPGPPTPSKNGGRLSFGNSEPPREILREFGDHNNTSKTPARFRFLTQRFSVGSSGLPRDELPRSTRPNLITGMQRRRLRRAVGLFCTSTPRKSRSYYDQQRMINARNTNSSKTEDEQLEDVEQLEVAEQLEEQEQLEDKADPQEEADQQGTPHLTNEALLALTKGNTRRLTGQAKLRKGRVSLCLHGNIFAKSRPAAACLKLKMSGSAVVAKREKQSRKLRQERMGRFDLARHLDQMYLSNATPSPESAENNNYSLHNRNEDPLPNQLLMGKTMVLKGRSPRTPAGAATFRVEKHCDSLQLQQQFELENMATFSMEGGQSAFEETQEDWQFEELCKKTESSAPFKLRLLDYKPAEEPAEPKLPPLVASCSNITTTSCATNITSASSRKSCTVYSMGSVHMQPMPHVDITYVQPTERILQKPMLNRSLLARCRLLIRRLSSSERLIVGFLLLTIVWMCSILADRMVLALTGVLAGMGLILLITS
ncbi:coiled-coil domain-containing protein 18 isoform X2 [Drosophila eugracilis]|uniref:coiled-coil domain-containing protein 18 isoform X2 n=1 Tax=Drosophila eugracilis TaxID=29029 RepID=UPI0007E5F9AC|nr:coiled-coil domain-containing protein 18 isoform X2 [Drosophila eugracilis]